MKNSLANIVLKRENKTFNFDAKLELFEIKFGAILIYNLRALHPNV